MGLQDCVVQQFLCNLSSDKFDTCGDRDINCLPMHKRRGKQQHDYESDREIGITFNKQSEILRSVLMPQNNTKAITSVR